MSNIPSRIIDRLNQLITLGTIPVVAPDAPASFTVTTSSQELIADSVVNRTVLIANTSAQDVFLSFESTAEVAKGILLVQDVLLSLFLPAGLSLNAIVTATTSTVVWQSFAAAP